jgi:hypothetical protein
MNFTDNRTWETWNAASVRRAKGKINKLSSLKSKETRYVPHGGPLHADTQQLSSQFRPCTSLSLITS